MQSIIYLWLIDGSEPDTRSSEKWSITYYKLPAKQCSKKLEREMKVVPGEHAARKICSCKYWHMWIMDQQFDLYIAKIPVLEGNELTSHCVGFIPYYTKLIYNKITLIDRMIIRTLLDHQKSLNTPLLDVY